MAACVAGLGITQTMELGAHQWLADGSLVELFPELAQERLPLYVYYPSRRLLSAKIRAFLDLLTADID